MDEMYPKDIHIILGVGVLRGSSNPFVDGDYHSETIRYRLYSTWRDRREETRVGTKRGNW